MIYNKLKKKLLILINNYKKKQDIAIRLINQNFDIFKEESEIPLYIILKEKNYCL